MLTKTMRVKKKINSNCNHSLYIRDNVEKEKKINQPIIPYTFSLSVP